MIRTNRVCAHLREVDQMSRHNPDRDATPIIAAASRWRERCMLSDGSVFSDNVALWTTPHLDELDRAYVQNLDLGEGNFLEKLERQLSAAALPSRKLMAEARGSSCYSSRTLPRSGSGPLFAACGDGRGMSSMPIIRFYLMACVGDSDQRAPPTIPRDGASLFFF